MTTFLRIVPTYSQNAGDASAYVTAWRPLAYHVSQLLYSYLKKFWGNSENAVRIQIYSAVISYCIRAIVQKKMRVKRSVYEMLQIVSVSLTDTTPLRDLFGKPNYNIVNELDDYSEPTLFDF